MSLPTPGTVVADKYRLESLLATGGMGAVFRARHIVMEAPVALKWLLPELVKSDEARERLLREARAVARVRHPNVVQVYDVDTHEDSPFIVMELLDGETFEQVLLRGDLPLARAVEILLGAMSGLSAAHEHGLVHRDIKPENIFIVRDRHHPAGLPKLIDFGISKVKGGAIDLKLTQTGHAVGTPVYMSLEQLTRSDEVDARTDIYSFGAVLYRTLTGVLPFDGETFAGVVLEIATTTPASPKQLRPELPEALDQVVMKAMARRPEDRYDTIDDLINALRPVASTLGDLPAPRLGLGGGPVRPPHNPGTPGGASALGGGSEVSGGAAFGLPRSSFRAPVRGPAPTRSSSHGKKVALAAALLVCAASLIGWAVSRPDGAPSDTSRATAPSAPPAAPIPFGLEPPTTPAQVPVPRTPEVQQLKASPNVQQLPTTAQTAEPPRSAEAAPSATREPEPVRRSGKAGARAATGGGARGQALPAKSKRAPAAASEEAPSTSVVDKPATEKPTRAAPKRRSGELARDDF